MDARSLTLVVAAWLLVGFGLIRAAASVGTGDGWPFIATGIIIATGGAGVVALLWLRQMPVAPGDHTRYRTTALVKLATAAAIGLVAFGLAIAVGPWWVTAVGFGLSLLGLTLAWPSARDRERHELLYLV